MNVEYFKADLKNLVPCALFKRISVECRRSGPTRPKDPETCEENQLCDWEGDIFNAEPRKERRGWGFLHWEQQVCRLGSHTCSRWPLNPTWDKFFRLPQMPIATGWCQYFCWDSESRAEKRLFVFLTWLPEEPKPFRLTPSTDCLHHVPPMFLFLFCFFLPSFLTSCWFFVDFTSLTPIPLFTLSLHCHPLPLQIPPPNKIKKRQK